MDVFGDFEPMCPGFESRRWHNFFFIFIFLFFNVFIFLSFLSLLLQCKFANSTLLSLLSFSYFITPYDAQACSAFSALIVYQQAVSVFCGTYPFIVVKAIKSNN